MHVPEILIFITGWSVLAFVGWRIALRVRRLEVEHRARQSEAEAEHEADDEQRSQRPRRWRAGER